MLPCDPSSWAWDSNNQMRGYLTLILPLFLCVLSAPANQVLAADTAVTAHSDRDGDGISDPHDRCPNSNPGGLTDHRGCEHDTDSDGVVDIIDECPHSHAGSPVNTRGCNHDSDKDAVVDFRDACPNTTPGVRVDATGCPLKDVMQLPGLVFAKGTATLNRRAKAVLDRAANTLFKYPDLKVEVAGFTDSRGNEALNRALSQRRADAVRSYLISLGLAPERITARGYGEDRPVATNSTAAGRAANRRVLFFLSS
ncbi:MAG: OmpA family protein [Gammaproteobacteria bacterium]|nr:OmpA family protein [Gammaproteobacteria bacterium]